MAGSVRAADSREEDRSRCGVTQGGKDTGNVELRKRFFDFFMKRIGRIKHLFTCSITREFLRNRGVEMEKVALP